MNTTGQAPITVHIEPQKSEFRVNDRVFAEATTRWVLRKAARGPSSLVGGSLASGVTGPAYTQP